ncbi:hypothetical protein RCL1_004838 [Eukaryota sp. TZLM3-RCL]
MHLIDCVYAGCSLHTRQAVSISSRYLAYASCLSIYIYDIHTLELVNIIAKHEKHILSICWRPSNNESDSNLVVTSVDKTVRIFASPYYSDQCITLLAPETPLSVCFSPSSDSIFYVVTKSSDLFKCDIRRPSLVKCYVSKDISIEFPYLFKISPVLEVFLFGSDKIKIYVVNPKDPNKLKQVATFSPSFSHSSPPKVVSIEFDPFSDNFVLFGFASHGIYLYDLSTFTCVRALSPNSPNLSGLGWSHTSPGSFVSSYDSASFIKHHLISVDAPIKSQYIDSDYIQSLHSPIVLSRHKGQKAAQIENQSNLIAGVSSSGNVFLYSLSSCRSVFSTSTGHPETVFSCSFSPTHRDVLATCSFDSSVRLWKCFDDTLYSDDKSFKLPLTHSVLSYHPTNTIIYHIAWRPSNYPILASGHSDGSIAIYYISKDLKKPPKKMISVDLLEFIPSSFYIERPEVTNFSIIRLHWITENQLMIGNRGGFVFILDLVEDSDNQSFSVTRHRVLSFTNSVFGVDTVTLPNDDTCHNVAIGCQDGNIYHFTMNSASLTSSKTTILKGHTAAVFEVVFNHRNVSLLASGSDDFSIRIWNTTSSSCIRVLTGHNGAVRPILWHSFVDFLLISGAWDGSIRGWNVITGDSLMINKCHHADVYGLSLNPSNPNVLASSSRDLTIRFWNLKYVLKDLLRVESLSVLSFVVPELEVKIEKVKKSLLKEGKINLEALPSSVSSVSAFFDFINSKPVHTAVSDASLSKVFNILSHCNPTGFCLFLQILSQCSSTFGLELTCGDFVQSDLIVHETKLMEFSELEASLVATELTRGRKLRSRPQEVLINQAGLSLLSCGNFEGFCDLMVEQGDYETALAVAPLASYDTWRRVIKHRINSSMDNVADYKQLALLLADQQVASASNLLYDNRKNLAALTVCKLLIECCPSSQSFSIANSKTIDKPSQSMISLALKQANGFLSVGDGLRAAATFLSVCNYEDCIRTLLNVNEVPIAFLCLKTLPLNDVLFDTVVFRFCLNLTSHGEVIMAFAVAKKLIKNSHTLSLCLLYMRSMCEFSRKSGRNRISDDDYFEIKEVTNDLEFSTTEKFGPLLNLITMENFTEAVLLADAKLDYQLAKFNKSITIKLLEVISLIDFGCVAKHLKIRVYAKICYLSGLVMYYKQGYHSVDGPVSLCRMLMVTAKRLANQAEVVLPSFPLVQLGFRQLPHISSSFIPAPKSLSFFFRDFFNITQVNPLAFDCGVFADLCAADFETPRYLFGQLAIPY